MSYDVFNDEQEVNDYLMDAFLGKIEPNFIAKYQDDIFHATNLMYLTRFSNFITSSLTVGSTNYIYNKITVYYIY